MVVYLLRRRRELPRGPSARPSAKSRPESREPVAPSQMRVPLLLLATALAVDGAVVKPVLRHRALALRGGVASSLDEAGEMLSVAVDFWLDEMCDPIVYAVSSFVFIPAFFFLVYHIKPLRDIVFPFTPLPTPQPQTAGGRKSGGAAPHDGGAWASLITSTQMGTELLRAWGLLITLTAITSIYSTKMGDRVYQLIMGIADICFVLFWLPAVPRLKETCCSPV